MKERRCDSIYINSQKKAGQRTARGSPNTKMMTCPGDRETRTPPPTTTK